MNSVYNFTKKLTGRDLKEITMNWGEKDANFKICTLDPG